MELTNYDGSKKVDLTGVVQEFNLHEDFMQITMYGNLVIFDSLDLIQEFPIIGEEDFSIIFSFKSSEEDIRNTKIKRTFRVYKISDITRGKNDKAQVYALHFISPEYFKNLSKTVPNAFTNRNVSDMASFVYNEYIKLDDTKVFDIEKTNTRQNIIIPFIYPFQAMSMLTKRAWSSTNRSSNYVFYEDRDGFHFRTIESFLNDDIKQTYYYRQTLGHNQDASVENKDNKEPFIIRNLTVVQMRDNLKQVFNRMYNSSVDTIDIIAKKYTAASGKYDYDKNFNRIKHLEKYPIKSDVNRIINNDTMFYPTELETSNLSYASKGNIKPKYWERFLPERKSAFAQLDSIVLEVTIPGDHLRKPGDIIEFSLPSATDLKELQGAHRYLSGRYLVTRVRHKINNESYSTVMQIVKESSPKKIKPLEA